MDIKDASPESSGTQVSTELSITTTAYLTSHYQPSVKISKKARNKKHKMADKV